MQSDRDQESPLRRNPRYHLLDVWRGVACLMVVLHHAGFAVVLDPGTAASSLESWLRWGFVSILWRMNLGVALFFVISGYCIGASVDATRRRGKGALNFLGRRIWRIYPPYWAALAGFVLIISSLDALGLRRYYEGVGLHALQLTPPGDLDAVQWVGNITLTEEWRPLVWSPPPRKVYTRVAWSLCYEEQFYFVCFAALLFAPRRLYGLLTTITLCAGVIRIAAADSGRLDSIDGSFLYLWQEFAIGLAVYWRLNVAESDSSKRGIELALGLIALWGCFVPFTTPVGYSTTLTGLFGLVLIALRDRDDQLSNSPWLRPLQACGRRCYSIYLIHLPVCTIGNLWLHERGLTGFWERCLVMIPLVSCASVGVSWLFFWGVERHFLNPPMIPRTKERADATA